MEFRCAGHDKLLDFIQQLGDTFGFMRDNQGARQDIRCYGPTWEELSETMDMLNSVRNEERNKQNFPLDFRLLMDEGIIELDLFDMQLIGLGFAMNDCTEEGEEYIGQTIDANQFGFYTAKSEYAFYDAWDEHKSYLDMILYHFHWHLVEGRVEFEIDENNWKQRVVSLYQLATSLNIKGLLSPGILKEMSKYIELCEEEDI